LREDFAKYSEGELIEAIKHGKQNAFAWLVSQYQNDVARTVIGMLGNVAEADDVGQEVFIRFYHSVSKFRGDSSIKTYLTRIAINLSLNELKRRKVKRWLVFEENYKETKTLSDDFESSEIKELVNLALSELEPNFRSVVVLRLIQGYSTKESAEILNLPQGTVLSRLARGQEKLRQIILRNEEVRSNEKIR
jgi:RNA polymerase sigma-70 factor (ECF subfamily)